MNILIEILLLLLKGFMSKMSDSQREKIRFTVAEFDKKLDDSKQKEKEQNEKIKAMDSNDINDFNTNNL